MMLEEQVRRLQNLLERVQRKRALPRVTAPLEASAAAPSSVEDDLLEEDIEEIATAAIEAPLDADASQDFDIDFDDEPEPDEEEAPASSRRQRAPTSMDEALAGVVEQEYRDNYEAPLHTPPPESGPQQAVAPAMASPTPEQIGDTVALEESSGPALELDTLPQPESEAVPIAEELEVVLPSRAPAGAYDESLKPPPASTAPVAGYGSPVETHEAPEMVVTRPPVSGTHAASFEGQRAQPNPSFAGLLDESLSLGS